MRSTCPGRDRYADEQGVRSGGRLPWRARPRPALIWLFSAIAVLVGGKPAPGGQPGPRADAGVHSHPGGPMSGKGRTRGRSQGVRRRPGPGPMTPRPGSTAASSCMQQGKLAEAIPEFRDGHPAQARVRRCANALVPCFDGVGKHDEAIAAYREAIRLKPDFADAHFNLGIALADRGKHAEIVAHIARPFGSSPTTPTTDTPSASRCAAGEAGGVGRGLPRGYPTPTRIRPGPQ